MEADISCITFEFIPRWGFQKVILVRTGRRPPIHQGQLRAGVIIVMWLLEGLRAGWKANRILSSPGMIFYALEKRCRSVYR